MKSKYFLSFLLFSLIACKKENLGDCFKSTGKIVEEKRDIPFFSKIELNDRINLYVTYSNQRSLKVRAGENLQEFIRTDVKENSLVIKNDNRCNWVRSFKKKVDVFLSTPDLREILYYGSGELDFLNQFNTDTLIVNLWNASGDVEIDLVCNYVELKINTGVGTISCKGNTEELVAYNGANGIVNTENTFAKRVLAVNENTGRLRVFASETLNVDIRGSGNVFYAGEPTINLSLEGEGKLIKFSN